MTPEQFAHSLVMATNSERAELLTRNEVFANARLARALKAIYDRAESSDVSLAAQAAAALTALAQFTPEAEVAAVTDWVEGMALTDAGQMEAALDRLQLAEAGFLKLGQSAWAAATQKAKLRPLAILGRFDEALECGQLARGVLLGIGDSLAVGVLEQNLGNIHFLRDQYGEAEALYRSARKRLEAGGDVKALTQIENNLATALTAQFKLREAEAIYQPALARAEAAGLEVTLAELECNWGCLKLFQGHYEQALDYLERSRRRYAGLGMLHETAIADQEMADAYLELNLAPEAAAIYARVIPTFAELQMVTEHARALAYFARARLLMGELTEARRLLAAARQLYAAAQNQVGEAMVTLIEAQTFYAEGDFASAAVAAEGAVEPLAAVNAQGRLLLARWLQGEAMRMQGELNQAAALLQAGLRQAEAYGLPLIAQRCLTSLGLLAETLGDNAQAESYFKQAVVAIEQARAPLPAEEFRTAFISDKLVPYRELLRLCLADGTPQRVAEALQYVERSRSRALLDLVSGALPAMPNATDPFEAQLAQRIETLREELNWFYSQINRPDGDAAARGSAAMTALYEQVHEREATLLDLTRQLQQRLGVPPLWMETFDPATLQAELGPDTVLIEYFSLDGDWLAFVVTQSGIEVVRLSATEAEVDSIIRQFHFQLGALRYGQHRLRDHLSVLAERARHHLAALYTALLAPLSSRLTAQRLIIVPHRSLHYVPFHALWAESGFVFEQREVVYVPSATILRHCLRAPRRPVKKAALFGVSDELAPHVRTEVNLIAPLFPEAVSRLDAEATRAAVLAEAPQAQVVHIASHGRFRPDNPLFSALQLTDGWLTVREAYQLKLECELVTLSACETGLSALAPGDELLGLARGFFATGAPALVVSLWAVDDEATAQLMRHFYQGLLGGSGAAAALRAAQLSLMQTHPHPYFWAPFILLGRW